MSRLLESEEAASFQKIIAEYQPDNAVLDLFRSSNFGIIVGPAGAGKDTLRNSLITQYPEKYQPILSTTTRPPREGEVNGQTYHFRGIEEVAQSLQNREFFQAALVHNQQISCLHISEIKKLNHDQCGLSILIPITETELSLIKSDIKTIFLVPPSYAVLHERLNASRSLDQAEIGRRLTAAAQELQYALQSNYYCIVTDTVQSATEKAHDYFQSGQINETENQSARKIMEQINTCLVGEG